MKTIQKVDALDGGHEDLSGEKPKGKKVTHKGNKLKESVKNREEKAGAAVKQIDKAMKKLKHQVDHEKGEKTEKKEKAGKKSFRKETKKGSAAEDAFGKLEKEAEATNKKADEAAEKSIKQAAREGKKAKKSKEVDFAQAEVDDVPP
mmetsp:Transcript_13614/g.42149  ORF Transcript_13614/g.42149 Transcript_13614/m.42149 type:complete len:147 (+) Transcript_13614:945-1385(+)